MAWDIEATKRKLLDAGARQFAARGFSGAHMEAIGRDAGVNKERVYQYFGDKRGFYAAVLADRLDGLLDGADLDGTGPEAVGAYAGTLFDRFQADPNLARLLTWESLELDAPASADHRSKMCAAKSSAIRAALPGMNAADAEHVLLSVVTLVTGWWTLAHLAGVILTPGDHRAERRDALVRDATALARAAQAQAAQAQAAQSRSTAG